MLDEPDLIVDLSDLMLKFKIHTFKNQKKKRTLVSVFFGFVVR